MKLFDLAYIKNIRFGFATNSSSSHSVVLLPPRLVGTLNDDYEDDQSFGWYTFTLASNEAKLSYIGQIVKMSYMYHHSLEEEDAALLASKLVGVDVIPDGHIDHQSTWTLPKRFSRGSDYDPNSLDKEFVSELINYIKHDNIAIFGGNDNDGQHPLSGEVNQDDIVHNISNYNLAGCVSKCDSEYGHYTLFNKKNGLKIRISFDDKPVNRSSSPELVDLKITDYCNIGCKFCYQGSTKNGKHAELSDILYILHALDSMKVFEVAIGGGEPTLHPDFIKILDYCNKDTKITPNFTTKNYKWLKQNFDIVKNKVGAIGVSISSLADMKKVKSVLDDVYKNQYGEDKVVIHIPFGVMSLEDTNKVLDILSDMNLPILFLGFKQTGRGKLFKNVNDFNIVKLISDRRKKQFYNKVSFDTLMVENTEKDLKKLSHKILWTAKEGMFSCYIDAVEGTMSDSSWDDPIYKTHIMNNVDTNKDMFLRKDIVPIILERFKLGNANSVVKDILE